MRFAYGDVPCRARNILAGLAVAAAVLAAGPVRAGEPVPEIGISLDEITFGRARNATTGRDGRFVFTNLRPGTYRLRITTTLGADGKPRTSRSQTNYNSSHQNVKLLAPGRYQADIVLLPQLRPGADPGMQIVIPPGPSGSITGKVEFERGGTPARR